MTRVAVASIVAVTTLLCAACGTKAHDTTTQTFLASAIASTPDPCTLLSPTEVRAALGSAPTRPVTTTNPEIGGKTCQWVGPHDSALSVLVVTAAGHTAAGDGSLANLYTSSPTVTAVPGPWRLAEGAVFNGVGPASFLRILTDDTYIEVHQDGGALSLSGLAKIGAEVVRSLR